MAAEFVPLPEQTHAQLATGAIREAYMEGRGEGAGAENDWKARDRWAAIKIGEALTHGLLAIADAIREERP